MHLPPSQIGQLCIFLSAFPSGPLTRPQRALRPSFASLNARHMPRPALPAYREWDSASEADDDGPHAEAPLAEVVSRRVSVREA